MYVCILDCSLFLPFPLFHRDPRPISGPVQMNARSYPWGTFMHPSLVSRNCPNAFVSVISNPINSMVPLVAKVLQKAGVYNPKKLVGKCVKILFRSACPDTKQPAPYPMITLSRCPTGRGHVPRCSACQHFRGGSEGALYVQRTTALRVIMRRYFLI